VSVEELEVHSGIPANTVATALASYIRTIRAGGSRFDRYMAGEVTTLSTVERAGLDLFRGKANCVSCHVGPNFTDERLHNTGVAWRDGKFADVGAGHGDFKTPTLREIARTAPYMHDGSLATLEDVVEYYSGGGRPNPGLDPKIRRLDLTAQERRALASFLQALNGELRDGWR
jgi:cytochrome c peroxidase